jgi:excisionase family DNA binding protein
MPALPFLTVPQVAAELQVTPQTIRNWIDQGTLPAVRIGRAFRVKRSDLDALLERASAESASLATHRDVWDPTTRTLPRRDTSAPRSIWDAAEPRELPLASPTSESGSDQASGGEKSGDSD